MGVTFKFDYITEKHRNKEKSKMLFDKRNMRTKISIFIILNLTVTLIIVYHEKILTNFDRIKMPVNDHICKTIPPVLSKIY